jgi:hypothetical protein
VGEEEAIDVIEIKDESEDEEGQAEDSEEEKEDEEVAAPGPGVLPISAPGGEDATSPLRCVTSVKARLKAGKDAWKAAIHVTGARGGARKHQLGHWPTKEAADRAVANHRKPDRPGRSALKGVSPCKRSGKFRAILNKKQLGLYETKKEAGLAYNAEVRRLGLPRELNVFTDDVTAAGASAAGSGFVEDGSGAEGNHQENILDDGVEARRKAEAEVVVVPSMVNSRGSGHLQGGRQAAGVAGGGGHRSRSKSPDRRRDRDQSKLAKRHRGPGQSKAGDAGAMAEGSTEATRMSIKAAATEKDKQREHEVILFQTLLKQMNDQDEAVAVRTEAAAVRAAERRAATDAAAAAQQHAARLDILARLASNKR